MDEPTWDELPRELRDHLDELIRAEKWFPAIRDLKLNPRTGHLSLHSCQELVFGRRDALVVRNPGRQAGIADRRSEGPAT